MLNRAIPGCLIDLYLKPSSAPPFRTNPPLPEGYVPYSVVALLSLDGKQLGVTQQGVEVGMDPEVGGSHLLLSEEAGLELEEPPQNTVLRLLSKDGRLSALRMQLVTNDMSAEQVADRCVDKIQTVLAHLSCRYDTPLTIGKVVVERADTRERWIRVVQPPRDTELPLDLFLAQGSEPYAALYREGMSSTSPAYAFLCFRKIYEAINVRRARPGASPVALEKIPTRDDAAKWLADLFTYVPDDSAGDEFVALGIEGWRFTRVYQETIPIRDRIAHALWEKPNEVPLDIHGLDATALLYRWSFVMRCIARRMLLNEFPKLIAGANGG